MIINMKEKNAKILCIVLAIAVLALAFFVEQVIQPGYLIKSIIKVCSFGGVICLYSALAKKNILDVINLHKPRKIGILIGCIALFFVGIGILFMIFTSQINWDGVRESLVTKEGLTRQNCFFVFGYIIVVNSFLEEAFFRGFFPGLFKNKLVGSITSALLFSAYHIGIIGSWFNVLVFLVCIIGLAFVGLFLQWLSNKYETIVADWMVHASANIAINVIGALLIFEIL